MSAEDAVVDAIHAHLHAANESACGNVTHLLREYLLHVARNVTLAPLETKALSAESEFARDLW